MFRFYIKRYRRKPLKYVQLHPKFLHVCREKCDDVAYVQVADVMTLHHVLSSCWHLITCWQRLLIQRLDSLIPTIPPPGSTPFIFHPVTSFRFRKCVFTPSSPMRAALSREGKLWVRIWTENKHIYLIESLWYNQQVIKMRGKINVCNGISHKILSSNKFYLHGQVYSRLRCVTALPCALPRNTPHSNVRAP